MVTKGLVVRLEARSGEEEAVAQFLRDALSLVEAEQGTVAWLAVRTGPSSFAIVDAFADDAARQEHVEGPVAAALLAHADALLAEPPTIEHVDVLAAKLP